MHCKSYSHFFSKKFQHICVPLDVNLNESLTNDIVSFEQLGPSVHTNIYLHTTVLNGTGFKAIFSVCLGTLIIIWENLGSGSKLILFYMPLEQLRVSKNAAKMGMWLDIYHWNPT